MDTRPKRKRKPDPVKVAVAAAAILANELRKVERRVSRLEGKKRRIGFEAVSAEGHVIDQDEEPDETARRR